MNEKKRRTYETMARDPFEGMEWPPDLEQEADTIGIRETTTEPALRPVGIDFEAREAESLRGLKGKGVWLLYSRDVDLAIEMALTVGATHVFYRTGERGMFFVDAAQRVCERVRQAGLVPFAWTFVYCDDPHAEAEVAFKSAQAGYQGIVFDVEDQAAGKGVAAATLGARLLEAGLSPHQLYYTSFPNIWQHLDIPYREMNTFCRGGFMPQCYPTFQRTARTVINKWAYGEHARWSREWGTMPPLYPVLSAYSDEHALRRLSRQEFLEWAELLADCAPPFFSIYHAGTTSPELWAILAALGEGPPMPAPQPPAAAVEPTPPARPATVEPTPPPTEPSAPGPEEERREKAAPATLPVYHVVTVNDTVWSLCQRYGITRAQFWEWNGHLWDEQWLPRDPVYLGEGWRVQVG